MGEILSYRRFLKTYKTRGHRINHLESYKHFFPIKTSPLLAGIVADLIGDGHLQEDPKWRIDFTSKSINELKNFEKRINILFNIKGRIRINKSNIYGKTYNLAINCSPITRILYLCGVPPGQKVLTYFDIPSWIKNEKECFREFCRRLFTCEASIMSEKNRKIPQIRFEMWKSKNLINNSKKFMNNIKKLLKIYFNINSSVIIQKKENIRKDAIITKPIRLYIFGESVIRFYNKIGFDNEKQKTLKALIST